jgi:hypothetical protein
MPPHLADVVRGALDDDGEQRAPVVTTTVCGPLSDAESIRLPGGATVTDVRTKPDGTFEVDLTMPYKSETEAAITLGGATATGDKPERGRCPLCRLMVPGARIDGQWRPIRGDQHEVTCANFTDATSERMQLRASLGLGDPPRTLPDVGAARHTRMVFAGVTVAGSQAAALVEQQHDGTIFLLVTDQNERRAHVQLAASTALDLVAHVRRLLEPAAGCSCGASWTAAELAANPRAPEDHACPLDQAGDDPEARETLKRLLHEYKVGDAVTAAMEIHYGAHPDLVIPPGTRGTVVAIDAARVLAIQWDVQGQRHPAMTSPDSVQAVAS